MRYLTPEDSEYWEPDKDAEEITIRLPKSVVDSLRETAEHDGCSLSAVIAQIIDLTRTTVR